MLDFLSQTGRRVPIAGARLLPLIAAVVLSATPDALCLEADTIIPEPLGTWSAPPADSLKGRQSGSYTPGTGKSCKPALGEGTLVCNCDPPGASVYLDGELVGEAPVRKECLPAGEYTLRLTKPGYEPSESRVTVKKDVTLTVEDKLSEAKGEVSVSSEPPGVSVVFDGRRAGVTPVTIARVTEGEHELKLSREYFEDAVAKVSMGRADRRQVGLTLKRRLLLVEMEGGGAAGPSNAGVAAVIGAFAGFEGVHVIREDIGVLADGLVERGLDASSLDFLKAGKTRLDIEDSAVLSGIMEQERVELAVTVVPVPDGGDVAAITLYSTASDAGDMRVVDAGGGAALLAGVERFLDGWKRQQARTRPAIGASVAKRPEGFEVTRLLTGFPAQAAGLAPGDVIVSVNGQDAGDAGLTALLRPGAEQEFTILRQGSLKRVMLTPFGSPVEICVDDGCLVNLALVDSLAILDDTAGQAAPREVRGYAALGLGNAYAMAGEAEKAVEAYREAATGTGQGVCTGTALYRLGLEYERLGMYDEAASAYARVVEGFPEATLGSADGQWAAPLAAGRLAELKKR